MDLKQLALSIEELAEKEFKREFTYLEAEAVNDTIEIYCDVIGGYEADVNCYFGGDEYVEDFINSIDFNVNFEADYEFDDEDMCANITLHHIQYVCGVAL